VIATPIREGIMTRLKYIEIDGKRYLWREVLELRREQKKAHARGQQPTLFELKDDRRAPKPTAPPPVAIGNHRSSASRRTKGEFCYPLFRGETPRRSEARYGP
jgi:hypothetical protein